MAIKLIKLLSELATSIRAVNSDDRISFRYLHSKFNSKLDFYFRLESKTMELFRYVHEWKHIDNIEFIEIPTNTAGYFNQCHSLKRSKYKIPGYFNSIFGPTFKLFDINGFNEFKRIDRSLYKDELNRQFKSKQPLYWISEGYIYLPDSTIENASGFVLEKIDGTSRDPNNKCNLVLQREIIYPDYLIELVKKEMLLELTNGYKRVVEDEKPDENTNQK